MHYFIMWPYFLATAYGSLVYSRNSGIIFRCVSSLQGIAQEPIESAMDAVVRELVK